MEKKKEMKTGEKRAIGFIKSAEYDDNLIITYALDIDKDIKNPSLFRISAYYKFEEIDGVRVITDIDIYEVSLVEE